ncbi:MAG: hypothetical protein A2Y62_11605 [Candidatus Fischerbacteria bacterium RBG_13_37_8]|uniref:Uncharacterized protein n=1 Tax=Candidatus Fischerbacteria bacterium RBG_13_37_8 TaxID=1817863 RepID=A0A1F5VI36_9BACT|nr:MAG: hypothetical protein A2Y62_11605 [Candidatus Fischerbacteria bacterium RBG_13_37_8]
MERIEFIKLMDKFAKFYKAELSEIQTDWWFETFKDIKADDFLNALNWHITHDQYNSLPAPGKITAALAALEEDRLSKPPPYPEFTTLWVRVIELFPNKQNYEHYPPDSDVGAWKALYDQVVRIPPSLQGVAVEKAMRELEAKYNVSKK